VATIRWVEIIAIIASFKFISRTDRPCDTITTPGDFTVVQATINIAVVPIVTGFVRADDTVAAAFILTGIRATITDLIIAVVTILTSLKESVATARHLAG
jgi:hypothetical protein